MSLVRATKFQSLRSMGRMLTVYSILWVAVFGVFGNKYIHDHNPNHDATISRMKNAVWIDLVNMLLWLVTAVMATVAFFSLRGGKSLHTGRATV